MVDLESQIQESADDVVALVAEMVLERFHLCADCCRFEHGDGGFLKRDVGSSVQV